MCGIVGNVGDQAIQEVVLAGLEKLEYRGYDSAGFFMQSEDCLEPVRAVGDSRASGRRPTGRPRDAWPCRHGRRPTASAARARAAPT